MKVEGIQAKGNNGKRRTPPPPAVMCSFAVNNAIAEGLAFTIISQIEGVPNITCNFKK